MSSPQTSRTFGVRQYVQRVASQDQEEFPQWDLTVSSIILYLTRNHSRSTDPHHSLFIFTPRNRIDFLGLFENMGFFSVSTICSGFIPQFCQLLVWSGLSHFKKS